MTPGKPAKSMRIQVYMTKSDHEEIKNGASEVGLSMPEFLRLAAIRALKEQEPTT